MLAIAQEGGLRTSRRSKTRPEKNPELYPRAKSSFPKRVSWITSTTCGRNFPLSALPKASLVVSGCRDYAEKDQAAAYDHRRHPGWLPARDGVDEHVELRNVANQGRVDRDHEGLLGYHLTRSPQE